MNPTDMTNRDQKGFSLVELLVVVIILGIIAAIAVPSLLKSRRAASEATAVSNLRVVHSAQLTYLAVVTSNNSFGTLNQLSTTAKFLDESWTATPVVKSTYTYTVDLNANGSKYCAVAKSSDANIKDYGIAGDGVIQVAANGAIDCASGDLTGTFTTYGAN